MRIDVNKFFLEYLEYWTCLKMNKMNFTKLMKKNWIDNNVEISLLKKYPQLRGKKQHLQ